MAELKKDFDQKLSDKQPAEMADDELEDVVGGVFIAGVRPDDITATPLPSRSDLPKADVLTPAGGAKQSAGLFRLIFRKGGRRGGSTGNDNGSMWI